MRQIVQDPDVRVDELLGKLRFVVFFHPYRYDHEGD